MEPFRLRDEKMWKYILDNLPKDGRKIKVLDMGSGRGHVSRMVACKLREIGRFESLVGINLSERENEYN